MNTRFVFGYGSLVNRRTHEYAEAHPAKVTGWRRAWRKTPLRARCFLTVLPEPGAETLGLMAAVPGESWAALDLRERGYDRHDISRAIAHPLPQAPDVALYAIPPHGHHAPGPGDHVALSYIDTVVQGFLTEFGEAGVRHFFDSTAGWELRVHDDRARPLYARAQPVSAAERALTDAGLARVGARINLS